MEALLEQKVTFNDDALSSVQPFGCYSTGMPQGEKRANRLNNTAKIGKPRKRFCGKRGLTVIWAEIGRVHGVPGAPHSSYEGLQTNFHWVWFYQTSESPDFNIFLDFR